MYNTKITLTKTTFEKKVGTKNRYKETKREVTEVTEDQYRKVTNDDTVRFFRRLGGVETKVMGYTHTGYICTKLTSTSPDRETKIVRAYSFIYVD